MKNYISPARRLWQSTFRAFRVAHNQIPIMSENGIAMRMQATREVRALTGKWDLPRPITKSFLAMREIHRKQYAPIRAFRVWMRAESA